MPDSEPAAPRETAPKAPKAPDRAADTTRPPATPTVEIGGAPGPDPTRYGDWQHKGRVSDF